MLTIFFAHKQDPACCALILDVALGLARSVKQDPPAQNVKGMIFFAGLAELPS